VQDLHIPRPALVEEIIRDVDKNDDKHLFVRGAAGFGKTILLRDIAQSLVSRGKTVLIAQNPHELQAWYQENKNQLDAVEPDYLLVDEIQWSFTSTAVGHFAAKFAVPSLLKARTIFAGIPSKESDSYMLRNRFRAAGLLLGEDEILQEGVVDYFQRLIKQGSTDAAKETKEGENKQAAMRALRFARQYSAGHMYPCLRLAEFFVKRFTASELTEGNMVKSMASAEFLAPGGPQRDITKRCFFQLDYKSAALLETCMQGEHSEALPALGLWVGGWLLSPLVHMALLKLVPPPQPRRPVIRSAGDMAKVLSYCCARLRHSDYFECDYAKQAPEYRARCEEGVSFSLGRHLVQLCGAVAFQHSVLPAGVKQARRPPIVDFYLNSVLDLYLKVVKNGSDLLEHFERFAVGDQYAAGNKAFVVLSFNFRSPTPELLPPALKMYQDQFYTFCVKSDTLYTGAGIAVEKWS
jgi:hypothetical protein